MKNKLIYILLTAFAMVYFSSCSMSIEKRRYRPGYHIDLVKSNQPKIKREMDFNLVKSTELRPLLIKIVEAKSGIQIPKHEVISNNDIAISRSKKLPYVIKKSNIYDEGCDIVYLKNGKTLQVTSVRVVERKLYYNNCGDNTTKVVPINIKTIKTIRLANGDEMDPNKDYTNLLKSNKKELREKERGSGRVVGTILMAVFGAVGIGIAVLFFLLAASMIGWSGIILAVVLYFLAGLFALGAIVLIAMAFVTGLRK